jgi:hypothetical protein
MSDSFGDGMCCSYRVESDGVMVASGGTFTSEDVTEFGNMCNDEPEEPEGPEQPEPTGCPSGTTEFKALINTDQYASENSWTLKSGNGATIHSGSGYANSDSIEAAYCISTNDCYTFVMADSFGDGMCCSYGQGSFSVMWDGSEVGSGGDFGRSSEVNFGSCPGRRHRRTAVDDGMTDGQKQGSVRGGHKQQE